MACQFQLIDPNFYKVEEKEIEVSLDAEKEASVASLNSNFEGSLNGSDKLNNQGIPDHEDDVIHYIDDDIKDESHESHQGSGHPQLEKQENLAAARVPKFRRTRPRIQLGLTPRQLSELEQVFEQTKYPDETTRRDLAKRLFLGESRVRRWFKRRRAKYRKTQQCQMFKCESDDRQNTLQ
ncbi:pituitary homeobox 2-like [Onychomys torridus]|uniref:pituitary homeobox 2-like n=1 Tax=Onychomys torridus TaxID=38674 RepID=UPI00167F9686|nr:pituitary homeobox 2-like [Onychomys torridus]